MTMYSWRLLVRTPRLTFGDRLRFLKVLPRMDGYLLTRLELNAKVIV